MYYVYVLQCADKTLYTGYTDDLQKRIKVHNRGKGAKYTRARLPVTLVYYEEAETKSIALSREYSIKKMTRRQKETLISAQMD
ncbi:GIY-YIG nuclease family protein [Clostridium sp. BNL1100]|uniref:GIY-YIG nuclease family protein n=1 Tax=Clostridium sp. BNL1100 TaxID=755731 RepID=UPI00024A73CA|nr:GIY-YIG nuclease family protein [Clostridium sp. BNL1100]AEY66381.1 putative endonuclease containing a URI domain [Clostridium sp. BNL1100]